MALLGHISTLAFEQLVKSNTLLPYLSTPLP